jgi:hypothetical protein
MTNTNGAHKSARIADTIAGKIQPCSETVFDAFGSISRHPMIKCELAPAD